jgi:hypothetical protein
MSVTMRIAFCLVIDIPLSLVIALIVARCVPDRPRHRRFRGHPEGTRRGFKNISAERVTANGHPAHARG